MAIDAKRVEGIVDELEGEAFRSAYVATGCQGEFRDGWRAGLAWCRGGERRALLEKIVALEDDLSELDEQVEAYQDELAAASTVAS